MSNEQLRYTFRINDKTPETMPFGRLLDYYVQLKDMLGLEDHLHLVAIGEGSHANAFSMDCAHEAELTERLSGLQSGQTPKKALTARNRINEMLSEDSTSGCLSGPGNAQVMTFPGSHIPSKAALSLRDTMSLTGELYYLAASGNNVAVRLRTESHGAVFGTTSKDVGHALRSVLFEQVKLDGHGEWLRHEDGTWSVESFTVASFTPVGSANLRETVDHIRNMDLDWPSDPLARLREMEEKNGQAH